MRFCVSLITFLYFSVGLAQQIDIPLLTIKIGKGEPAEFVVGPFAIDNPIDGVMVKSEWVRADIDVPYLKINKLNYANRAGCALSSKKPARSFSVIIDTMNAAKSAYRLAQAVGREPKEFTKMAVKRFRYSVMELLRLISVRLMHGELPLLPHDNQGKLDQYASIMQGCRIDQYCYELDDYIEMIWNLHESGNGNFSRWQFIDSFTRTNFIRFPKHSFEFGCYRQLKFSPLAQNYLQTRPTKESLEEIAQAHINQESFLEECDQMYQVESMESASFQGELLNLNEGKWNKIGFDFWHSLKLYFSWAWRNADEMEEMIYPFGHVFKSVHLEDSVMIIPNGCHSITEPRCDTKFLNEQTLRDFAKKSYESEITTFDHLKFMPDGASEKMLDQSTPAQGDFLELGKFETMEKWGENFRKNFTRSRGIIKGRLQSGITKLSLISNNLRVHTIIDDVKKIFTEDKAFSSNIVGNDSYQEIYYLCSEFNMLNFEGLSYKNDLLKLKQHKIIDPLVENLTEDRIASFYDYYLELSKSVNRFCKMAEDADFWDGDREVNRSGYRDWMKELVFPEGYPQDDRIRGRSFKGQPLLAYSDFDFLKESDRVICFNGIDCARNVLESMIKLYSVTQYVDTYFAPMQSVSSAALNNPYAERTACKVYDPWWKLKKGIFNLLSDVTLGLIGEFNKTPFFVDVDLRARKVVSFNQLWDEGVLKLDPQFDKKRLLYWAGVEFGPLLGASCSVVVSNTHSAVSGAKHFLAGITVQACSEGDEQNDLTVYNGGDSEQQDQSMLSGCFSCTLNFENVVTSVGKMSKIPLVGASFYLVRGIVRFLEGALDPVDTPRSWQVDVNNVLETYRRYGEVPKRCVGALKRGQYCLEDKYEHAASQVVQRAHARSIKKVTRQGNRMSIDLHGCSYPIFNISTNKLISAWQNDNYVEQIEDASYCEWNR